MKPILLALLMTSAICSARTIHMYPDYMGGYQGRDWQTGTTTRIEPDYMGGFTITEREW